MGGPAVVIGAAFGWIGKRYLDHALQKEQAWHAEVLEKQKSQYAAALEADKAMYASALEDDKRKYAAALEQQKSGREKHIYVYRSQFEVEFNAYRELWLKLAKLIDGVAVLLNYSPNLLETGDPLKARMNTSAKAADAAFFEANHKNNELRPFIDVNIHQLIGRHNRLCKDEIDTFFFALGAPKKVSTETVHYDAEQDRDETKAAFFDIRELYDAIGVAIRTRMASMLVVDE
jgi:hypothetical protein